MSTTSILKRCAFSIAAITLSGCAGSQSGSLTPNALPQSFLNAAKEKHSGSWLLPEAKRDALLYVTSLGRVYVYTYPKGKFIGQPFSGGNLCAENNGNIWVTTANSIVEYAHGGTAPIVSLEVPSDGGSLGSCTIDPTSGDLAVDAYPPKVLVYAKAAGEPKLYRVPLDSATFCGYDNKGSLFVTGYGYHGDKTFGVVKLQQRTQKFRAISFAPPGPFSGYEPKPVQGDGRYVAIANAAQVVRYDISRFTAVAKETTSFDDLHSIGNFWIQGAKIVVVNLGGSGPYPIVQIDRYPAGGYPIQTVNVPNDTFGVTVSIAPR